VSGILRGEIHWADLNPVRGHEQGGRRPVIVLSHDLFNDRSGTVIVMVVTSQPQRVGLPLVWPVPSGVLPGQSWAKISQIRTIDTDRLTGYLGRITDQDLSELLDSLLQLIG
jgi:mRNA interferase MazF